MTTTAENAIERYLSGEPLVEAAIRKIHSFDRFNYEVLDVQKPADTKQVPQWVVVRDLDDTDRVLKITIGDRGLIPTRGYDGSGFDGYLYQRNIWSVRVIEKKLPAFVPAALLRRGLRWKRVG